SPGPVAGAVGPAASASGRSAARAAGSPGGLGAPAATPRAPSPSGTPRSTASPTPALPAGGLLILEPAEGTTIRASDVQVRGLARPGVTVTRDIPLWPDDHAVADGSGRWSMKVGLNPGLNVLRFRIGDDRTTEIRLRIVGAI